MIFAIIGSIGLAFAPLLLTVREPVRKERAAPTRAEADNRPSSPGFWSFARRNRSLVGPIYLIYIFATRSEEHTSELQSLMRISYAVFCLKKKTKQYNNI